MADATVAQAQMLSERLRDAVAEFRPRSLAILGVAGGNGLETVDPTSVQRVVALDLNAEYLAMCAERHAHRFARFEAVHHDLSQAAPSFAPVDLIFAGLILEYVYCDALLGWLPSLLLPRGVFITVLQLPSLHLPTVSASAFPSLRGLESVFHFVEPSALRSALVSLGFTWCDEKVIRLESGKEFHHAAFTLVERPLKKPR